MLPTWLTTKRRSVLSIVPSLGSSLVKLPARRKAETFRFPMLNAGWFKPKSEACLLLHYLNF